MLWYALPAESVRAETFRDARKLGIKSSTDHTHSTRHSPGPEPPAQRGSLRQPTAVPLAVGSLSGTSISTTLTAYTISLTSSSYQIEQGAILNFQITITITGTTTRTISLLYDGAAWPSQVIATFQQRIGFNFYSSFKQTGLQTNFFSRNWTGPV